MQMEYNAVYNVNINYFRSYSRFLYLVSRSVNNCDFKVKLLNSYVTQLHTCEADFKHAYLLSYFYAFVYLYVYLKKVHVIFI